MISWIQQHILSRINRFFGLRIRTQLAFIIALLTICGGIFFYRYTARLQKEMFARGFTQSTAATFEAVRLGVELGLASNHTQHSTIDSAARSEERTLRGIIQRANQDSIVVFIMLYNTAGDLVDHYPERITTSLYEAKRLAAQPSLRDSIVVRAGVWRCMESNDSESNDDKSRQSPTAGMLYIGFSTRELREREDATMRDITITTGLSCIIGLGLAYLLASAITRPLDRLQATALQIAFGDTARRADDSKGDDNTRALATSFNLMVSQLRKSQEHVEKQNQLLAYEQKKNLELLQNMLPQSIAERLKDGEAMIADSFDEVTVVFADLVGFTQLSSVLPPAELIDVLNRVFSLLDEFSEFYGVEKIKTIGDSYMLVSGAPVRNPHHIEAAALMALEILEAVALLSHTLQQPLQVRVGMHVGPVVAGVIGTKKFAYDLWGDTVNIASRMESQGEIGRIQCTEAIYQHLHERFDFEERGVIDIRGKGSMRTYFLLGQHGHHPSKIWQMQPHNLTDKTHATPERITS
jgi:class 3 adenylate cyclase